MVVSFLGFLFALCIPNLEPEDGGEASNQNMLQVQTKTKQQQKPALYVQRA